MYIFNPFRYIVIFCRVKIRISFKTKNAEILLSWRELLLLKQRLNRYETCLKLKCLSPPLLRMSKHCSMEMVTKSVSDLPFASCLLVREWWNIRPLRLQTRRQGWVVVAHRPTTKQGGTVSKVRNQHLCQDDENICLRIWGFHGVRKSNCRWLCYDILYFRRGRRGSRLRRNTGHYMINYTVLMWWDIFHGWTRNITLFCT